MRAHPEAAPRTHWQCPEARLRRARALANLLDTAYRVPGTKFQVGLDPILGLIPGLGDLLSLGLSAFIVHEARQLECSRLTLARMVMNLLLDTAVGSIPILGDLFDVAYKANARNLVLLEADLRERGLLPIHEAAAVVRRPEEIDPPEHRRGASLRRRILPAGYQARIASTRRILRLAGPSRLELPKASTIVL